MGNDLSSPIKKGLRMMVRAVQGRTELQREMKAQIKGKSFCSRPLGDIVFICLLLIWFRCIFSSVLFCGNGAIILSAVQPNSEWNEEKNTIPHVILIGLFVRDCLFHGGVDLAFSNRGMIYSFQLVLLIAGRQVYYSCFWKKKNKNKINEQNGFISTKK